MTKVELLNELKETLQRDEDLKLEMKLEDIEEWDSLAIISFIVMADQKLSKKVDINSIKSCKTVEDLMNVVQN